MQRMVVQSEGEKHLQAYLEYRMIVGDRDGGVLLPEAEYEKLRKEFYAKREEHNLHFVDTSKMISGGKNKRLQSGSEEMKYEQRKQKGSKTKVYSSISPLELYNKEPDFSLSQFRTIPEEPVKSRVYSSRMLPLKKPSSNTISSTTSTTNSRPSLSKPSSSSTTNRKPSSTPIDRKPLPSVSRFTEVKKEVRTTSIRK
ncbi:predicted protein [Naegleria gruberi]|uniref:Predicted protein n=1 Tax=Naegleria gruberi TaxID=5762 RepID=D2VWM9_NAEGR|nr:uncharacterized protein NAEGRDRAFT_73438 [Naegleria gruberi]EFC38651.1 predicted protein [Naegleria gruberi]|eukprot:XP_002671395.1 predicted protein [Naegleria gruberi strain NEG-M]